MKYTKDQLIEKYAVVEVPEYSYFGEYAPDQVESVCLGQWYVCPFRDRGTVYHSAGQYMMAKKALLFGDQEAYERIMAADQPEVCRELGLRLRGFSWEIWENEKEEIVLQANIAKFSGNPDLWAYLDSTGDTVLVEAGPNAYMEDIWGVDISASDPRIRDPKHWTYDNLWGFALMETRDFLRDRCRELSWIWEPDSENFLDALEITREHFWNLKPDSEKLLNALGITRERDLVQFQAISALWHYKSFPEGKDYSMIVCRIFKKGNLWGALSKDYGLLTDALWDNIEMAASGYRLYNIHSQTCTSLPLHRLDEERHQKKVYYFLKVQRDGKYGILDTRGRIVTDCKWDEIDLYGNCRLGDKWGFVNLLTMEETAPQWNESQHLNPYTLIEIFEESIAWRFGHSCEWRRVCDIFDGSCLRNENPGDDPQSMA